MERKQKTLKVLKTIGTVFYLLTTIFLIIMLASLISDYLAGNEHWKLGGAFLLIITLAASIAYIIPIILGGIGVFISARLKNKRSKLYCIFMIFVPVITAIANFVTYLILLK